MGMSPLLSIGRHDNPKYWENRGGNEMKTGRGTVAVWAIKGFERTEYERKF